MVAYREMERSDFIASGNRKEAKRALKILLHLFFTASGALSTPWRSTLSW